MICLEVEEEEWDVIICDLSNYVYVRTLKRLL